MSPAVGGVSDADDAPHLKPLRGGDRSRGQRPLLQSSSPRKRTGSFLWFVAIFLSAAISDSRADDLLVVDRLTNGVYRYSESGAFLGIVTKDVVAPGQFIPTYLFQPTGLALSPDYTQLYVSSSFHNHVVKYDYDRLTGLATSPTIFADASDGLDFPNDIQFSPDQNTVYVANLNGGVSRFNVDGSSAGTKLFLPTVEGEGVSETSSMTFTSDGRMLVGAFTDPSGEGGGIAISNLDITEIPEYAVEPTSAIRGATGLMIHENYLYVSGLFTRSIRRFSIADLENVEIDPSWVIPRSEADPEIPFPQDLIVAPDGNGFLAGILGAATGAGRIARFAFDGTPLGTFALPNQGGFREATAFTVVPTSLPGDFNGNGTVDILDYVVWRSTSPLDESQYEEWRENFGSGQPGSAANAGSTAVPEPSGVLLAFIAILAASRPVRRERF